MTAGKQSLLRAQVTDPEKKLCMWPTGDLSWPSYHALAVSVGVVSYNPGSCKIWISVDRTLVCIKPSSDKPGSNISRRWKNANSRRASLRIWSGNKMPYRLNRRLSWSR